MMRVSRSRPWSSVPSKWAGSPLMPHWRQEALAQVALGGVVGRDLRRENRSQNVGHDDDAAQQRQGTATQPDPELPQVLPEHPAPDTPAIEPLAGRLESLYRRSCFHFLLDLRRYSVILGFR